ncbi:MAG: hypothetical protein DDT19_00920 [Syntrophomonadaceae bacterium]|nr:hypothetical protein [Bacillota bacterium]
MRFKPRILKFSKLGSFTFLVLCFFFSLSIPLVEAKGAGKIDDRKLNLILEELDLSGNFIQTDEGRIFYTRSELKEALNQPIRPEEPRLTYGGHILIALYEKNLIKSIASREYAKRADRIFNAILDINVPAQIIVSALNPIPDPSLHAVGLKTLQELFRSNKLRFYFNERYAGNEIHLVCKGNWGCEELTPWEKKYFESLWENWGEYYTPGGAKRNIDSATQENLQNNIVLAIKELNTQVPQPTEEKDSLSWWQKIKNFFSQLIPFLPAQVSRPVEDGQKYRSDNSVPQTVEQNCEQALRAAEQEAEQAVQRYNERAAQLDQEWDRLEKQLDQAFAEINARLQDCGRLQNPLK